MGERRIRDEKEQVWKSVTIINGDKSSALAEMGDRLATIDMGQKLGGLLCPF